MPPQPPPYCIKTEVPKNNYKKKIVNKLYNAAKTPKCAIKTKDLQKKLKKMVNLLYNPAKKPKFAIKTEVHEDERHLHVAHCLVHLFR